MERSAAQKAPIWQAVRIAQKLNHRMVELLYELENNSSQEAGRSTRSGTVLQFKKTQMRSGALIVGKRLFTKMRTSAHNESKSGKSNEM